MRKFKKYISKHWADTYFLIKFPAIFSHDDELISDVFSWCLCSWCSPSASDAYSSSIIFKCIFHKRAELLWRRLLLSNKKRKRALLPEEPFIQKALLTSTFSNFFSSSWAKKEDRVEEKAFAHSWILVVDERTFFLQQLQRRLSLRHGV